MSALREHSRPLGWDYFVPSSSTVPQEKKPKNPQKKLHKTIYITNANPGLNPRTLFGTINGLGGNPMKIKEDIKSISYLKSRSAHLIFQINETHRPVIITQKGEPRAVIQDAESYEKTMDTLNLMKILVQGEKAVQKGNTIKQENIFKKMDEKLMKRKTDQ